MTLQEIMEFILLPCVGWLLVNSSRNGERLSRIEAMMENFLSDHPKHNPKKNE